MSEADEEKEAFKNLTVTKAKSDGNIKLIFEEKIKVPTQVQNLMINGRESMRLLEEDADNGCDKPKKKDPLD